MCGGNGTMMISRADDLKARTNEAAGTLSNNDEPDRNVTNDYASPTAQVAAFEARWYYYHVSTP